MKRYATEFTGTFFLVLIVGLTIAQNLADAPLAIGAGLAGLVYMGGPISGAHYNPAVTLAIHLCGKPGRREFSAYLAAQLSGATAAAFAVRGLTGTFAIVAPDPATSAVAALAAEALFTFALALVILNVAISPRAEGNGYYGVAIGLTVMGGAYAVGPVSGGAFNPAVGTGPILAALAGGGGLGHLWIYWAGPLAGAVAAAAFFRLQHLQRQERAGEVRPGPSRDASGH